MITYKLATGYYAKLRIKSHVLYATSMTRLDAIKSVLMKAYELSLIK